MKLPHAITTLATPFMSLAILAAAANIAVAQDDVDTAEQRERPTTTLPDSTESADRDTQQTPLADTDCVDLPDSEVADSGQGAGAANAQGNNPQADVSARGSRADENRSVQGAANANAEIARNRDDCLDLYRDNSTEDSRNQGSGN